MFYVEILTNGTWHRVAAYTRKQDAERDMMYAERNSHDPRPIRLVNDTGNGERHGPSKGKSEGQGYSIR